MPAVRSTYLVVLLALTTIAGAAPKYDTWIAPKPQTQLYNEGLDDRKGLGRIFVPVMTSVSAAPFYAVFHGGELVGEQNMGSSFFLTPGDYTVVLGSGTLEQRIRKDVTVHREETVIIEPDWAALTIEVIDEIRNYIRQDMQIFHAYTGESYGLVPAINPELGEQLQTLILPPGLYKVVKRGEDFNTYVNFTTLTLEPGAYTPLTIVIDSNTGNFTGAGILQAPGQQTLRKAWRLFGAIHGSVNLNSANDATSAETRNNLSLLTQVDNRLLFDRFPHYYLSRNLVEFGALQQEGSRFTVNQDRLQLKSTYIYYLLQWLGGYGRLELTTHLFPTTVDFDSPSKIYFIGTKGDTTNSENAAERVTVEPVLYPLQLKEGLGVNLTPLRSFRARLSLRAGLGYWQIYNHNVYRQDPDHADRFLRVLDNFPQGLETALLSNFALLRNLTITTELDVLFPFDQRKKIVMDLENFITLGVSKHVTIEHTLRLKKDETLDYLIREQFVSLRFSYFFF